MNEEYFDVINIGKKVIWEIIYPSGEITFFGNSSIDSMLNNPIKNTVHTLEDYLTIYCGKKADAVRAAFLDSFNSISPISFIHRIWNEVLGKWQFVCAFGEICELPNNGGKRLVGGIWDVNDRVEHQKAMLNVRKTEERMQIMFDATPLCCNYWDNNYNNIDCNAEAVRLFDLSSKQEYLDKFFQLSPELQPSGINSAVLAEKNIKVAFKTGYCQFEWLHQKLNGEPIPAEITLVRQLHGEHYIVAGYTRDLRDLKHTQTELDKERMFLKELFSTSPVCFAILVDGIVRFGTPYMESFMGIGAGDDMRNFYEVLSERAKLLSELDKVGAVNWRPIVLKTRWGEKKEMLANLFFVEYYKEQAITMWLIDITEMRKVENELRAAKNIAEESVKTKSDFLANMSHEIRTPMNAILGMTHLLQRTQITYKQKDYIKKMETSAKSLLRVINDILDFSKIEAGRLEMEYASFELFKTVDESIDMVRQVARRKGLRIAASIDPEVPVRLIGDFIRLKQVILNLLNNAVKFTEDGSVTLDITKNEISKDNIILQFAVRDTGIGLSENQTDKIFMPFSQGDTSTTRKYGGTGLGLVICKNIVSMMNGHIWCESHENIGSTFFFTAEFGICKEENEQEELKENADKNEEIIEPDTSGYNFNNKVQGINLLLVEDNEINQMLANELLSIEGFVVDIVSNGLEAISKLESNKNKYRLILMDIQMPEMDGVTATKEIRKRAEFDNLPIIAMTAHAMSGDRELSLSVGMNDHITKPIIPEQLYETIDRWLIEKS